jgi:aspartate aminotransferase-like enzyme
VDRREDLILLTPGPVHVDPARFAALEPMHHRTGRFRELVIETGRTLGELCGASRFAFLMAASGTGAMEAVIANIAPPGSSVLVVEGGKFGRRWGEIAGVLGCEVDLLSFPMGGRIDSAGIARRAEETSPDIIALTHVESSSGLLLDIGELASSIAGSRALIALDAIASAGSERILFDEWGVDVLAGAGQKALAAPAGVSFVLASERALEAAAVNPRPSYYFSFDRYERGMRTGDTPFTPAVHSVQLLHDALRTIVSGEEGIEGVLARHREASAALTSAARDLGMRILAEDPSSSVQAFIPPEGVSCEALIRGLGEGYGIIVAGGQEEMAGRVIRTGFPGIHGYDTLKRLVKAFDGVLSTLGSRHDLDTALSRLSRLEGLPDLFHSPLT